MEQALKFEIMHKDDVIGKVEFNRKTQQLLVEDNSTNFLDAGLVRRLIGGNCEDLQDWFEDRCFLRTRADKDLLLTGLGLKEYAPYNIVRKTHGVLFEDNYWARFNDENELKWSDVDPRRNDYS